MAAVEEASALLGLDCAADQELAAEDCLDRAALALAGCKDYTLVNDRESQSHDTMRAIWALAIELADAEVTPC
jgi:hypothetical protein